MCIVIYYMYFSTFLFDFCDVFVIVVISCHILS